MLTLPMRIMGKVIHLLRSSSILVSNGRYYLYWTLHTPATGRRKKKMSDLLKSLLGSFTLCLVLQDDKQIASETLNKLLEVTGVENQNKSLEEETTSAQPFSFPTEDPTKWNYSILALTFVTLFLAFLILVLNSRANKFTFSFYITLKNTMCTHINCPWNLLKNTRLVVKDPLNNLIMDHTIIWLQMAEI
ncbi:uncharacterized protein [Narcine bancroftii]|uniref:uncharacterized protein isoform X6 n=1 Tax=Narcine bancroftii TaxID=1343680 RepID=UPI003831298B